MNYIAWAVVALVGYSVFTPLASLATNQIPSTVVALVANSMLALGAAGVIAYRDESVVPYLLGENAVYMYAAGVFLTVGILAYYQALGAGPVSTVVPIFGMFLVGSSLLGVVFLNDPLTAKKALGIVLAAVGVYLTTS
ncbi:EamA family transporter [Halorussus gelatinilyticus]|uniref:EamA family transporter n=1 Tax=Halorussus gelatinilyticus TaxID=2937524 RepID=A0A8U0IJY1_9EURY|nr:EamA family transporter [Halorussus gelatinilyticus]UPW01437.1 EamA family transporter [Halorussus gelatinilyticus]